MPKKSKKKDKNPGKPKNRVIRHPEVVSDVSMVQNYDVQYCENPMKSDADTNKYRVIELPNGLVGLLISCPTDPSIEQEDQKIRLHAKDGKPNHSPQLDGSMTPQEQECRFPAICCLCVNAGFFSDPRQVQGVSRVLGAAVLHPAFKNGPEISSKFKKILEQESNSEVVSRSETTLFYIKATHRVYREAIERLGRSLESVFISKSEVEMSRALVVCFEGLKAHHSTPEKQKERIFSQFVPRRHPAKMFGDHYLEALCQIDEDKVYREVQKFRKRHYSAHRMTVVMKAELPLDTLETHAKECFGKITNNGLPLQLFDPYNFANSVENTKFRRIWRIDSPDCNEIFVKWIVPPSSWLYRTKSLEFLGWLFSYGGAGSLMSYLKTKKWATEVHGEVLDRSAWNTSLYSTFCVSVTLTAIGNSKNKLNVLEAIYSYINFLRKEGPQKSIYDDIRIIKNAEFRFGQADLRNSVDIKKLSEHMHLYPSTDYLAAPFFWYEYDPVSLTTCLDLMTPTKGCIIVTDERFGEHLDIKLAGLGRDEKSTGIPEDWIVRWQTIEPLPDFKLPEHNIFCPDDLRMIVAPVVLREYPVKVHSDSMSEVWYKFESTSRVPKSHINFCYVSPLPLESPENAAMLELFALVLKDLTHDELYPATVAGLSYTIESYFLGLGIRVSGYTQKLPLLAQFLAQSIPKSYHSLTKRLFEKKKEDLLGLYSKNFSSDRTLAKEIRCSILKPGQWISVEKHAALSCLQFERFQHFMKHFVDHVYIKCLVEGNIAEADAVKNALRVVEVSQCGPLARDIIPRARINKIPHGKHCCAVKAFRFDSSDVTVENYYQFDDSSVELGGILQYLEILSTHALTVAFCGEQFQTIVNCGVLNHTDSLNNYVLGLAHSGTSTINAKRIASIDEEIEEHKQFPRHYVQNGMSDGWRDQREVVLSVVRKNLNTFQNKFMNNWNNIVNGEYAFGKVSRQLDAVQEMDSTNCRNWIEYIKDDSNIRKLSIRIIGDKYSRADFSTVKTQPNESNTGPNDIPLYRLEYLTEHAGRSGNSSYNYITDINEYKKQLEASSNTNLTSYEMRNDRHEKTQ